jgi:hypothetical protein
MTPRTKFVTALILAALVAGGLAIIPGLDSPRASGLTPERASVSASALDPPGGSHEAAAPDHTTARAASGQGTEPGPLRPSPDDRSSGADLDARSLAPSRGTEGPLSATFPVVFLETGLLAGTKWAVTLNGTTLQAPAPAAITFESPNGTFDFNISDVPGWRANSYSGLAVVNDDTVVLDTAWTRLLYPVTFSETGLPPGTGWSVVVNGSTNSSSSPTISLSEPNGSYAYNLTGVPGWRTGPYSGSIAVFGFPAAVSVKWIRTVYVVTFQETNLPGGTAWRITVNGSTNSTTGSALEFEEPNGTFGYSVWGIAGWTADAYSGTVSVVRAPSLVSINWSETVFLVTLTESGLTTSTAWSVSVNGATLSSTSSSIEFEEPNGSYTYFVKSVTGYTLASSGGSFAIAGFAESVAVHFSIAASTTFSGGPAPAAILGMAPDVAFGLLAGISAAALIAIAFLFRRRNPSGPRGPPRGGPSGPNPSAPDLPVSFQGALWIWPKGTPGWEEQGREGVWPVSVSEVRRGPTVLLTPEEPKDYIWSLADQYFRCLEVVSITNRADVDREVVIGAVLKDLPPETGPERYRLHVQLVRPRSTWIPSRPLRFAALPGYRFAVGLAVAVPPRDDAEAGPDPGNGPAVRRRHDAPSATTSLPPVRRSPRAPPARPWSVD